MLRVKGKCLQLAQAARKVKGKKGEFIEKHESTGVIFWPSYYLLCAVTALMEEMTGNLRERDGLWEQRDGNKIKLENKDNVMFLNAKTEKKR